MSCLLCAQVEEIAASDVFGMTALAPVDHGISQSPYVVPNRKLTFTKKRDESRLRLWYYDNMRPGSNGGMCQWNLLIDGQQCPSGPIGSSVYRWFYG
jgi:hypothetical protein